MDVSYWIWWVRLDLHQCVFRSGFTDRRLQLLGHLPIILAEGQRFELWGLLHPAVFKTAALNHSANPPLIVSNYLTTMELSQIPIFHADKDSNLNPEDLESWMLPLHHRRIVWRSLRVSISLPLAWQASALPIELKNHVLAGTVGFEPTTCRLTADCTTIVLHTNFILFKLLIWWAWTDLNRWHLHYEWSALTNWATGPEFGDSYEFRSRYLLRDRQVLSRLS